MISPPSFHRFTRIEPGSHLPLRAPPQAPGRPEGAPPGRGSAPRQGGRRGCLQQPVLAQRDTQPQHEAAARDHGVLRPPPPPANDRPAETPPPGHPGRVERGRIGLIADFRSFPVPAFPDPVSVVAIPIPRHPHSVTPWPHGDFLVQRLRGPAALDVNHPFIRPTLNHHLAVVGVSLHHDTSTGNQQAGDNYRGAAIQVFMASPFCNNKSPSRLAES